MNRTYRTNKIVKEAVGKRVEEFDSRVLEDWMHHIDDGDDLVDYYATAIAYGQHAVDETDDRYGYRDDVYNVTDQAVEDLEAAFDDHLLSLVAEVCATVAQREGDWTDHRDEDEIEAAVHEARNWLQAYDAAAKRAGVWDEVTA